MGFLRWLFGRPSERVTLTEPPQDVVPEKMNQDDSNKTDCFSFFVDGLQIEFKDFSQAGESVKLWIPKVNNPDKVYIYHRNGPGGCLGIVPSKYSDIIASHLINALDYDAVIEELTDNTCKIKCRLVSKEKSEQRKEEKKDSLKKELTKAYNPKKPITIILTTQKRNAVKVGDKLIIEFGDLDSYLQNEGNKRGPYSCQWQIKFLNQTGDTVGIFENDKSTIQRILKAHFNSFLFDVEVLDIAKERNIAWKGYPTKLVITPYKSSNTSRS